MVEKIICVSDIHIRNLKRMDEYQTQLKKFIEKCKKEVEKYGPDSIRIVITGDLLHNKLDISGEGYVMASQFLKELDKIAKTIVIGGNHDINMSNLSRLDPLSAIFIMCNFQQTYFLDKELNYTSGIWEDDNIAWCLYSCFDDFKKPNIEEYKLKNEDKTYIGLFHGNIKSAKTDVGYLLENGFDVSYFEGLDICLCGHIHKRQKMTYKGIPIFYIGSLIQQDHGETITGHGFSIVDVETLDIDNIDISNEWGFYTMLINNEEDIDENTFSLLNY